MEIIKLKNIDEIIYYEKMDNGLPVYMLINKNVNNYYITLNVKYGSLDTEYQVDNKDIQVHDGIAHYLEHVNFNEDDNYTANDYFKNLGSFINAFTTFQFTAYEVTSSNKFKKNLEHLLDYVEKPYFTKELIEKERGIIIEEVKMGKNNPNHKLFFGLNKCLFQKNKRRNLVTGEVEDVKNITLEEIKNVYDTFYHPENMFLVITGNFNPKEAISIIKENQAKKKFNKYKKPIKKKIIEPIKINKKTRDIETNIEIPKSVIAYKIPINLFKIDKLILNIYLNILLRCNFGSVSSFKEDLVTKRLINGISAYSDINEEMVIIEVAIDSEKPKEVIPLIKEKMNNLEITEEDIIRRKRSNIASLIKDYDDIEYVNTDIAYQLIEYNKIYDNMYDIYNDLSYDEASRILDVLNKNLDNYCIVNLVSYKKDK